MAPKLSAGDWVDSGGRLIEKQNDQRWACNKHLRYAVHLFSEHTITRCAWAEIYYKAHRAKDHSHATALRCLGQRWLKIIHKMWMDRTPYNPEFHHRNQVKHGSWVFRFQET